MRLRDFKDVPERHDFISTNLGVSLSSIARTLIDPQEDIHCENLIGAISLPLGVAGPIKIKGDFVKRDCFIPLATTEGALIASVNRGAKAISQAGGAIVSFHKVGTTRGPVFIAKSPSHAREIAVWVQANKKRVANILEIESRHLKFLEMTVKTVGRYLFLRIQCDTDQAMGMNMITLATHRLCEFLEQNKGIVCLAVAGNFDIDKKPAWLNILYGRGYEVWADVQLTAKIIKEVLKTTPQRLFDVWISKCMVGSAMSGSLGFNAHFANIVAAFFAATGQDLGHIVEGSTGFTVMHLNKNGSIHVSVYMPSIMLGTVGGGTRLKTQSEAQSITGSTSAQELVEVLGAAVLAGEVSLLASLAQGTLAKAHKKLGR